jgi:hypothetical protein
LTEELAWFLGLYFGIGSNHQNGIRIHGNFYEQKEFPKIYNCIKDLFGLEWRLSRHTAKDGRCSIYVNSTALLHEGSDDEHR